MTFLVLLRDRLDRRRVLSVVQIDESSPGKGTCGFCGPTSALTLPQTRQRPLLLIVTASDLPPQPQPGFLIRTAILARALALALLGAACTSSSAPPVQQVDIGSVTISGASFAIERGHHAQLTAVVRSRTGTVVTYPVG